MSTESPTGSPPPFRRTDGRRSWPASHRATASMMFPGASIPPWLGVAMRLRVRSTIDATGTGIGEHHRLAGRGADACLTSRSGTRMRLPRREERPMEVKQSVRLPVPVTDVWKRIGGFNALFDWHPMVEKSEVQG